MVYGIGFTTSFRMMNLYGSLGFKTNGESWFVPKAASPDRYSREFRRWHGFNDEISVIQWKKKIITGEMSTTPMVEMREQPLFASPFELLSWPHVVSTAGWPSLVNPQVLVLKQLKIQCFFWCFPGMPRTSQLPPLMLRHLPPDLGLAPDHSSPVRGCGCSGWRSDSYRTAVEKKNMNLLSYFGDP